jgi:uncharacterized protein
MSGPDGEINEMKSANPFPAPSTDLRNYVFSDERVKFRGDQNLVGVILRMARLARIQIFPFKSMDAQSVEQALVLPGGALQHDRQFALVDAMGELVNGKRTPLIQRIRSRFDFQQRTLTCTIDGRSIVFQVDAERAALEQWFSDCFPEPVTLVEDPDKGFPDDPEAPGPTVLSTATLETIAHDWFADLTVEEVRNRFRANLEIDGVEPFWEDRLYAQAGQTVRFTIGGIALLGTNPCQRCVVPTRDSQTGARYQNFHKIFRERREETLPAWADRSRFNHFYRLAVNTRPGNTGGLIRLGDRVEICG